MPRGELEKVIRFLRAQANPLYVLLPAIEYVKYAKLWGLPAFTE
jgi:hypothetical protein